MTRVQPIDWCASSALPPAISTPPGCPVPPLNAARRRLVQLIFTNLAAPGSIPASRTGPHRASASPGYRRPGRGLRGGPRRTRFWRGPDRRGEHAGSVRAAPRSAAREKSCTEVEPTRPGRRLRAYAGRTGQGHAVRAGPAGVGGRAGTRKETDCPHAAPAQGKGTPEGGVRMLCRSQSTTTTHDAKAPHGGF